MPSQRPDGGVIPDHLVRKRSLTVAGHRTSLSLEEAFWRELKLLARQDGLSVAALVERIDRERAGNLSSAVRVYILERLRNLNSPSS